MAPKTKVHGEKIVKEKVIKKKIVKKAGVKRQPQLKPNGSAVAKDSAGKEPVKKSLTVSKTDIFNNVKVSKKSISGGGTLSIRMPGYIAAKPGMMTHVKAMMDSFN